MLILGICSVISAAALYRVRDVGWHWLLAFGLVAFLFGLLAVVRPQTDVEVIGTVFGLFAFVEGAVLVVSGFAIRSIAQALGRSSVMG